MSDAPTPQTPTETEPEVVEREDDRGRRPDLLDIPAGRRTTGNNDIVKKEAELVAEGKELDNPAVPESKIVGDALSHYDADERPAWFKHYLKEAARVDVGEPIENPLEPHEQAREAVLEELAEAGLEPAWVACRGAGE